MRTVLLLGVAGALGSMARYGLSALVGHWTGNAFPWGIFVVNVLGCFLFGAIWAGLGVFHLLDDAARIVLLTGFMGAVSPPFPPFCSTRTSCFVMATGARWPSTWSDKSFWGWRLCGRARPWRCAWFDPSILPRLSIFRILGRAFRSLRFFVRRRARARIQGAGDFVHVETAGHGVKNVAVGSVPGVQFVVRAGFDNAPLAHDVDAVGVDDLRNAVRDDDHGPVFFDGVQAVLDLLGGHGRPGWPWVRPEK